MIGLLRRRSREQVPALATPRLRLIAMTSALLNAEMHDRSQFSSAFEARIASDWPPEHWEPPVRAHILAQLTAQPQTVGWHRYMLCTETGTPVLVGCLGAFPCAAGDVELGYSVVGSRQRRGFATEAANALVVWLFEQEVVHSVSAQAYVSSLASVKVMERCGMLFVGQGDEAGTVRYRRWRQRS